MREQPTVHVQVFGVPPPIIDTEFGRVSMERAVDGETLAAMARAGRDDEASRILCAVAARLHAPRLSPPPELVPLARWFAPLEPAAAIHGGILAPAATAACALVDHTLEEARAKGKVLTFQAANDDASSVIDLETRSTWNAYGLCLEGPLKGTQLQHVILVPQFWFAWSQFRPGTRVFTAP